MKWYTEHKGKEEKWMCFTPSNGNTMYCGKVVALRGADPQTSFTKEILSKNKLSMMNNHRFEK